MSTPAGTGPEAETVSPAFEIHDGAVLMPTTRVTPIPGRPGRANYDGGVHTADGSPVPLSRHRGDQHVNLIEPRPVDGVVETLGGTWLYGGMLRRHFGHFLRETVGRLYAWKDHGPFDGIVFMPHGANPRPRLAAELMQMPALREMLRLLGIEAPLRVPIAPTRFERLAVPAQLLFRPGPEHAAASARLRAMFRSLATGPVPLDGLSVGQVYVSRGRLGPMLGRFLLEDVIEDNFRRAGYAIVHPERLGFATQVAVYRGARRLVFAEGSAVHLAAPMLPDGAEIGVLWRGRGPHPTMRSFVADCGHARLHQASGILGFVGSLDPGVSPEKIFTPAYNPRTELTLPDFARFGRQLAEAGLVPPEAWRCPDEAEVAAAIEQGLEARRRAAPGRQHLFHRLPVAGAAAAPVA